MEIVGLLRNCPEADSGCVEIVGLLRNYPEAGSGGEGAPTAGECAVA